MQSSFLKHLLEVNTRVHLARLDDNNDKLHFGSRVEDIVDDFLHLSCPQSRGALVPFEPGRRISVTITKNDGLYGFHSTVHEFKAEPFPVLILKFPKPEEINRIQRRHFYRLHKFIPVKLTTEPEKPDSNGGVGAESQEFLVRVVDLSGGGIGFKTKEDLEVGTAFKFQIRMEATAGPLALAAKIIRKIPIEKDGKVTDCLYGCIFQDLDPRTQDRIVRYTMEQQRLAAQNQHK